MDNFDSRLLTWFDKHGRHQLPWQQPRTPYRVWLSEIMLQQTQVVTVIPYFLKFLDNFPTIEALANASQDAVLALWSGLGYYSRARNLHRAAQIIKRDFNGKLPNNQADLLKLPGIGKTTANAILSMAYDQAQPILDGNVKRVLTRYLGIEGVPSTPSVEKQLWQHAYQLMPTERCADYTQAIMDLGALICKRTKPLCHQCPHSKKCQANLHQLQHSLPTKKQRIKKPIKHTELYVIANHKNQILLEKRDNKGIWGGLWCLPGSMPELFLPILELDDIKDKQPLYAFKHIFTHFQLEINAVMINKAFIKPSSHQSYVSIEQALELGLPSPVKKILEKFIALTQNKLIYP